MYAIRLHGPNGRIYWEYDTKVWNTRAGAQKAIQRIAGYAGEKNAALFEIY
jgi:hypothetical protein